MSRRLKVIWCHENAGKTCPTARRPINEKHESVNALFVFYAIDEIACRLTFRS